jgi:hypothetical protein
VPKSCEDLSQPKSCEDLNSPTYCEDNVVVDDYDWGQFTGSVSLTLGTGGLSGSVEGAYCPTDGSCMNLASGNVRFGNPMEACIDIGGLGEVCAPF